MFTLKIDTGNACKDASELRALAAHLRATALALEFGQTEGKLQDAGGRDVGSWSAIKPKVLWWLDWTPILWVIGIGFLYVMVGALAFPIALLFGHGYAVAFILGLLVWSVGHALVAWTS